MPIVIEARDDEDPEFIDLLRALLRGVIRESSPERAWLIQIDNWFDHKWLWFSGKGAVDFQFPAFMNRFDGALEGFYQDKITFPPFSPNRVLGQWSFVRDGDRYLETPLHSLPHPTEKQDSSANLQRRVERLSHSALYLWYSANSAANGRASVMVYSVSGKTVGAWFVSFICKQGWKLQAMKGISRDRVELLMAQSGLHLDS
jgi:hypothetical protein